MRTVIWLGSLFGSFANDAVHVSFATNRLSCGHSIPGIRTPDHQLGSVVRVKAAVNCPWSHFVVQEGSEVLKLLTPDAEKELGARCMVEWITDDLVVESTSFLPVRVCRKEGQSSSLRSPVNDSVTVGAIRIAGAPDGETGKLWKKTISLWALGDDPTGPDLLQRVEVLDWTSEKSREREVVLWTPTNLCGKGSASCVLLAREDESSSGPRRTLLSAVSSRGNGPTPAKSWELEELYTYEDETTEDETTEDETTETDTTSSDTTATETASRTMESSTSTEPLDSTTTPEEHPPSFPIYGTYHPQTFGVPKFAQECPTISWGGDGDDPKHGGDGIGYQSPIYMVAVRPSTRVEMPCEGFWMLYWDPLDSSPYALVAQVAALMHTSDSHIYGVLSEHYVPEEDPHESQRYLISHEHCEIICGHSCDKTPCPLRLVKDDNAFVPPSDENLALSSKIWAGLALSAWV